MIKLTRCTQWANFAEPVWILAMAGSRVVCVRSCPADRTEARFTNAIREIQRPGAFASGRGPSQPQCVLSPTPNVANGLEPRLSVISSSWVWDGRLGGVSGSLRESLGPSPLRSSRLATRQVSLTGSRRLLSQAQLLARLPALVKFVSLPSRVTAAGLELCSQVRQRIRD